MFKNSKIKVVIVFLILILPSFVYVVSILGKNNFNNLPYYENKTITLDDGFVDTIEYKTPCFSFVDIQNEVVDNDIINNKIILFSRLSIAGGNETFRVFEQMLELYKSVGNFSDVVFITVCDNNEVDQIKKDIDSSIWSKSSSWKFIPTSDTILQKFQDFLFSSIENELENQKILPQYAIILIDFKKRIRGCFNGINYASKEEIKDAIQQLRYVKYIEESKN